MNDRREERDYGRRQILGLGAAILFGRVVAACSSTSSGNGSGASAADACSAGAGDAAVDGALEGATDIPWATGGTAAMTGKASYPNPFTGMPSTCVASCELTQGPCYSSQSVELQDISYGYSGLPMRMMLQVTDESCKPLAGAVSSGRSRSTKTAARATPRMRRTRSSRRRAWTPISSKRRR
jgi:hypothetical protein